ncbi:hypothetical protein ACTU3I_10860 [Microbacterium sp. RD1]|uniref:hypothetical protein n=1 Tax=Microbacterium sp. RD1 TaxID=3457313 RepID=UPI003FA61212
MSTRSTRAVRGAAFAAVATVTAATAHTLAGGGAPSPLFCAVLACLLLPVTTILAGRRIALWRTALTIGVAQAIFHTVFAVTGDLGTWQATGGHVHSAPAWIPHAAALLPTAGAPMIAAHAVAAVLTIAVVARGERVVRAVAAWLPRVLGRIGGTPDVPESGPAGVAVLRTPAIRRLRPLTGTVARRGPPSIPSPLAPAF